MVGKKVSSVRKHSYINSFAFGNAIGIVSLLALVLSAIMVWFSAWSGSVIIEKYPIPFSFNNWSIILGFIEAYVLGYIGGWIVAKLYNSTI